MDEQQRSQPAKDDLVVVTDIGTSLSIWSLHSGASLSVLSSEMGRPGDPVWPLPNYAPVSEPE